MKKQILTLVVALCIGFSFQSCEKDDQTTPINQENILKNTKSKTVKVKSLEIDLTEVAQAANIDQINYSNGEYYITFHDATSPFTVEIISFDDESLIEYEITDGSTITDVSIDVIAEAIDYEDLYSFTFVEYESVLVSSSEDPIKNVVAVITAHHSMNAETSQTFSNNGNDDVYPASEPEAGKWKFWGWATGTAHGPCGVLESWREDTKFVFGIPVKTERVLVVGGPC